MGFKGWPAEAIEFYEGLEADNSKSYWQAHKPEYDELVLRPMQQLLAELAPEFGEGRVFRPYRDIRFSPDKSPYKTNIAATLGTVGYIQLSADGLGVGSGMYQPDADQLDRYRQAVVDERSGQQLAKIVRAAAKRGIEVTAHETLKTAPRGYPKDHPRVELLRHKGLVAWRHWPVGAWLGTSQAKKRVVDFLHASAPLRDWLVTHVA
ncbi:MAG TPA: DUF2461 domain-containing protein [Acidimicrobiales bacterium]|nr:DUF2461 domain-containing protein [Acidimicrobiales bacterium]